MRVEASCAYVSRHLCRDRLPAEPEPSPSLQFEPVLDDAAPLVDIVVRGLPYQVSSHARLPYASRCVTCSTGLRVVGP